MTCVRIYNGEANAWNSPVSSRDEPKATIDEEVMEVIPGQESPNGTVAKKGKKRNTSSREGKPTKNGGKASKGRPLPNPTVSKTRQMDLTQMFSKG